MTVTTSSATQLFSGEGQRKYLAGREWAQFFAAARRMDEPSRTFCYLLAYSGCRISEGLALTPERLDLATGKVIFQTLKRRRRVFRAVPVPSDLMTALRKLAKGKARDSRLWEWSRPTAWRRIKHAMFAAGITGAQAMPKGLRHGYAMLGAEEGVPAGVARDLLGHADLETTAIYQQAVGREEQNFARRIWRRLPPVN